jgi:superfamily I DNA and RNA helicase
MARYDDIIEGYQEKQATLRRQIAKLRAGQKAAGAQTNGVDAATIHRTERQIADLDKAIARCREKANSSLR